MKSLQQYKAFFSISFYAEYEDLLSLYKEFESTNYSIEEKNQVFLTIPNEEAKVRIYAKWLTDNITNKTFREEFTSIHIGSAIRLFDKFLNNLSPENNERFKQNNYFGIKDLVMLLRKYKPTSQNKNQTEENSKIQAYKILSKRTIKDVILHFEEWNDSIPLQETLLAECMRINSFEVLHLSYKLYFYYKLSHPENGLCLNLNNVYEDPKNYSLTNDLTKDSLVFWLSRLKDCTQKILDDTTLIFGRKNNPNFDEIMLAELHKNYVPHLEKCVYKIKDYDKWTSNKPIPQFSEIVYCDGWKIKRKNTLDVPYFCYLCFLFKIIDDGVYNIDGETVSRKFLKQELLRVQIDENTMRNTFHEINSMKQDVMQNSLNYIFNLKLGHLSFEELNLIFFIKASQDIILDYRTFLHKCLPEAIEQGLFEHILPAEFKDLFGNLFNSPALNVVISYKNRHTLEALYKIIENMNPQLLDFITDILQIKEDTILPEIPMTSPENLIPNKDKGVVFNLENKTIAATANYAKIILAVYLSTLVK